tara:strand:+ start:299 stop:505 length:207 start_codon:yes stop_codon:yes gene_type:complete
MSFNEGETITIHNTDNDTTANATIVDFKGDFLRVLVDGKVAMNLHRKDPASNVFVGNMHGLEFTTIIK